MAIRALPDIKFNISISRWSVPILVKILHTRSLSGPVFTVWLQYVPVIGVFQKLFLNSECCFDNKRLHVPTLTSMKGYLETMARPEQNEGSTRPSQVGRAKSPTSVMK